MTKTARHELALDDLDAVVGGGGASPMTYFHPVALRPTGTMAGMDVSSPYVTPSAANNYGLANHFQLAFPLGHDGGHAVDGIAPSVPGQLGAPGASAAPAALPLSLVPIPGELGAPATPAPAAAPAPADAGPALYLGLPGGTDATADPTHGDASHPSNDWAPGSFSDSTPASSTTGW